MKSNTIARALGVAGLLATTAMAGAASAETTQIRIGYSTLLNTGFHLYMSQITPEVYAEHGIEVVPVDMRANAANCMAALLGGEVDMCSVSATTGIFAAAEGAPIKAVALLQGPVAGIYISDEAAAKTGVALDAPVAERLAGLKGLSIAAPAAGTLYYNLLAELLADGGLGIDDINYRTLVDQIAMREGLANEAFDGVVWSAGVFNDQITAGDVVEWINIPRGDAPDLAALPTVAVYASDAWLAENGDKVEDLHAAFVDIMATLQADPDRIWGEIKAQHFPEMDDEVWSGVTATGMNALWPSATVSEESWNTLLDLHKAERPDMDFTVSEWGNLVLPVARGE